MTLWFRSYWDEADLWFYFEVDGDGWVSRQVELLGPAGTPITAASLEEWQHAQVMGRLSQYAGTYGSTAEIPIQEWEGYDPHPLTRTEFEAVWTRARRHLEELR
ncbi:hypothetical protein [Nonomuraea dietziae]|uniref:hypothetical protein n=1 Tax=Nonomuraea dietziae TaxID=65515 RepID=UPI0033F200C6